MIDSHIPMLLLSAMLVLGSNKSFRLNVYKLIKLSFSVITFYFGFSRNVSMSLRIRHVNLILRMFSSSVSDAIPSSETVTMVDGAVNRLKKSRW